MKKNYPFILSFFWVFLLFQKTTQAQIIVHEDSLYQLPHGLENLYFEQMKKQEVVSVSKIAQPLLDAPATIHVITDEQIQIRGYANLLDVLYDIPEVEIQQNAIAEIRNSVGFRGISGNEKFIIMQDGIRINPASGDPQAIAQNYALVNVQRVEVILGPASALYGVDAFGGIINIITKKTDFRTHTFLQSSYGNLTTTENTLVVNTKVRGLGINISAQQYYSAEANFPQLYKEEFKWYNEKYKPLGIMANPFGQQEVQTPYTDRTFRMPATGFFINTRLEMNKFEIGYLYQHEGHSTAINSKPEYAIYDDKAVWRSSVGVFYAKHEYELSHRLRLFSTFTQNNSYISPESSFNNFISQYQRVYKNQYAHASKIEEQVTFKLSNVHTLIGGFSFEHIDALPQTNDLPQKFDLRNAGAAQNVFYPGSNVTDYTGHSWAIPQDFYYIAYQNYGSYLQIHSIFSKKIALTLGGRYDANTRFGSSINPRLGLVISPEEHLRIKLIYGEAFLAPSPWKTYKHFGSFFPVMDTTGVITGLKSNFFHLPNPNLKPEKLRSGELNISWVSKDNLSFTADAYYNKINNLINFFGHNTDITHFKGAEVVYVETSLNQGEAETYGGSIRGDYWINTKTFRLNVYGGYAYSNGRVRQDKLILSAMHNLKAGIDLSNKRFSFSLRGLYRSDSYSGKRNSRGEFEAVPSSFVLNTAIRYLVLNKNNTKFALFLKINNLTNAKYYHAGSGSIANFSSSPQDPLRFLAGFSFSL